MKIYEKSKAEIDKALETLEDGLKKARERIRLRAIDALELGFYTSESKMYDFLLECKRIERENNKK
jgi:hypothetical protein